MRQPPARRMDRFRAPESAPRRRAAGPRRRARPDAVADQAADRRANQRSRHRFPALPPIALPISRRRRRRPPCRHLLGTGIGRARRNAHAEQRNTHEPLRRHPRVRASRTKFQQIIFAPSCARDRPKCHIGAKLRRRFAGTTSPEAERRTRRRTGGRKVWLSSPAFLPRTFGHPSRALRRYSQNKKFLGRSSCAAATSLSARLLWPLACSCRRRGRQRTRRTIRPRGQDRRAVPGRRHRRRHAAASSPMAVAQMGPAGGDREPNRRRRQYRRRSRRQRRPGRLHAAVLTAAAAGDQPEPLSASGIRSGAIRADRRSWRIVPNALVVNPDKIAADTRDGIHRIRQGQSRQGTDGHAGQRHDVAPDLANCSR